MKKFLAAICASALFFGAFPACSDKKDGPPADVAVAAIKGPSAIGMIKLMDDADGKKIQTNNFSFEIYPNADEIVPKIVQGKIDIAAVPPNLSSVLYSSMQGKIQVIAITTLGMMYVAENGETINSLEDLRGKTVYAAFKGKSPEYDLNYILKENGIDPEKDLVIEWKSEHSESVAAIAANENAIAVLPQPFAAIAQTANENIRIALDLNHEWDEIQKKSGNPSMLITGVVVARAEFIDENPGAISDFLERYKESVNYAINNVGETAELVGKYGIFPEAVAQKAIPYCNMTFIEGQNMKEKLSGYLGILFGQNPNSVGGALPNEDFYFIR
ncbi:MAG: ABC transporter substrate-binding protein [Oscillospiraceae bacterium]|nr:ABC transporter substrate-binding protein [Oscillospiraceae bacterium]